MIKRILQVSVPLLLLAAPLAGCGSDKSDKGSDTVTYNLVATGGRDVSGHGSAKIEYTDSTGKTTTTHVDLPWQKSVTVKAGTQVNFTVWPEPAAVEVAGVSVPQKVGCEVLAGTESKHSSGLLEAGASCTFTA